MCGVFKGLGGVVASIASIITLSLGSGPVQIGFSYFIIAMVVTFGSLLLFIVITRLVSNTFYHSISRYFQQGHSQKFVLGGIKVFGRIKLSNRRSDVIFTP